MSFDSLSFMKTNLNIDTYKISVRTLNGTILTFTVDNYAIVEGDFVCFLDKKTNKVLRFHSSNCQIQEVNED